jgi:hypothetical protein
LPRFRGLHPPRVHWAVDQSSKHCHSEGRRWRPEVSIFGSRTPEACSRIYDSPYMTGLDDATTLRTLAILATSAGLTIVLGLLAFLIPRCGENIFRRAEQALSRFAKRKVLALAVLSLSVMAIRLLALSLLPVPVPGIHDEFSYLLMADTFAHGRLANPPHPMWVSFEAFHTNWFPTYSSMYPPAQGFALAFGQLLGHPWIGVLLSDAAMCAAILWMLQAWMPVRWAFLGAALVALKFGTASYWMNSYWGGAVAATGGALVLGALARIVRRAAPRDAVLLGLGIAILANSRPYEGLLFCAPPAAWFLWWVAGKTQATDPLRARLLKIVAPLGIVLTLTAAFMGYYNWRLTGNALLFPHTLNMRTYHTAPVFLWGHTKPELSYRNQQFEDFYNGWERDNYHTNRSDALRVSWEKLFRCGTVYFWTALLFLLPTLPFLFRDPKMLLLWFTVALVAAGVLVVIWSNPHYAAPLTCAIYALIVQGMRHLRLMRISARPVGLALSRAIVLVLVLETGINVFRGVCDPLLWPCEGDPSRAAIAEKLEHAPGKHLVVVRYTEDHNIHDDWVYNGANIDTAKVLWARELSPEQNSKLFAYFKDRQIWLATPDTDNTYLEYYTPPGSKPESDP